MNEFPRMIYKAGGIYEINGGMLDYMIVENAGELDTAMADGWALTPEDAIIPPAIVVLDSVISPDDAPPTRAELEAKATELGIAFDGRTSDSKLASKINAALQG